MQKAQYILKKSREQLNIDDPDFEAYPEAMEESGQKDGEDNEENEERSEILDSMGLLKPDKYVLTSYGRPNFKRYQIAPKDLHSPFGLMRNSDDLISNLLIDDKLLTIDGMIQSDDFTPSLIKAV